MRIPIKTFKPCSYCRDKNDEIQDSTCIPRNNKIIECRLIPLNFEMITNKFQKCYRIF
jgi:hypothetical protein